MNAPGGIPTEREIQRAILRMLGSCYPRTYVFAIPNGAHLAGNQTARFKQVGALKGDGMKVGVPDLAVLWAPAKGAFIEVKRPKTGRMSDEQKAVHARLADIRWPVAVVTSIQEAYDFLYECGAPRDGVLA